MIVSHRSERPAEGASSEVAAAPSPHLAVVGGLTLDDIVLPTGSVHRGVVGGNAFYTALGARLWAERISLISFVGDDFDPLVLEDLDRYGVDTATVTHVNGPSIRLWILYEGDGRRQIHYQHRSSSLDGLREATTASLSRLPGGGGIGLVHVAALPAALQASILGWLTPRYGRVTLDTIEARGSVGGDLTRYRRDRSFDGVAVFLPSVDEMDVIRADATESDFAFGLKWSALEVVVVKDGARGCRLYDVRRRVMTEIPAWPARVVDPTGAGDAFCGGFLAGMARRIDPVAAAVLGTVSASFAVEGIGGDGLRSADSDKIEARRSAISREVVHGSS